MSDMVEYSSLIAFYLLDTSAMLPLRLFLMLSPRSDFENQCLTRKNFSMR